jgi:AmmeMemoRadiSam system protein B
LPESVVAGIVPHAGWTFSGDLAALVFSAIELCGEAVETFVICGAAHGYLGSQPLVDDSDRWETPLGDVPLDGVLRDRLIERGAVRVEGSAHRSEHSIEVQVPFVQTLFPGARVLPVIVPPRESAVGFGEVLAEAVAESGKAVVCLGSTDLTHYGPRYGFVPKGVGSEGLQWASDVNDRAFVDLALRVEPERLLSQGVKHGSACGPGAAAATVAVARRRGIDRGHLLSQTTSNEIMQEKMGTTSSDSVGYAAVVF